ncbi:uncharacterized protein LOC130773556 isoform X1 [Actinidia eriantha]|uniref:uncharacterized protein LOC130773556 isoform X1 n=1 Tax=Actinidia eriantha TaxID=165200 RepID=UPI00258CFF73|nr:uncharacterized protein LOC130773556 isoform X1 [Actinidia eriantha]
MEESNELGTKAVASVSAIESPSHEVGNNLSHSREEGELSSSDDDELRAGSASELNISSVAQEETVPVASFNKIGVKEGRRVSTGNPKSLVDIPYGTSAQLNYQRGTEKNRTPFVPFVISFSDDDSGSDSEEIQRSQALETKGNVLGVDANRRPPASLLPKSQTLQRTTKVEARLMPKKLSLSRTFVSSITKINGANAENGGRPLTEQRSRVRNFNTPNNRLVGQEHGVNQKTHLSSSKLQDLRQQIAIRENELKFKSTQQNKEIVSGSSRDYNTTDSDNDTARKRRATSADFVPRERRDPEKKRLKLSDPHKSQLISNVPSGNSLMEDGGQQRINERIHRDKEIPLGKMHAGAAQQKKQDDTRHLLSGSRSTGVKGCAGADVFGGGSKCDRNTKLADPLISLEQPERIVNSSAKNFPKGSSELNCHLTQISDKATYGKKLTVGSKLPEVRSNEKANKPISNAKHLACSLRVPAGDMGTSDVSLNNASLCNCLGTLSISQDENIDMQSLLDMEELQDKELEVAQEHRLKCEIEERNALKAYRNAQRALIEANARCSYLYRKRELYSAHFRSLMMENSSLFWSSGMHNCNGTGLNSSNNMSEDHVPQIPTSSYQMQAECSDYNQQGHYSNIQAANGALQIVSDQHVDGQHLASDPCSEPDASTSEPHKNDRITDGVCSPSSDLNELADEDEDEETFPLDYKSVKSGHYCQGKEEHYGQRAKDINGEAQRKFSSDSSKDSLLLEATLRSQLFARLGTKTLSKKSGLSHNTDSADVTVVEHGGSAGQAEMNLGNVPFPAVEKSQHSGFGGTDIEEKIISELPLQNNEGHVENFSSNYASPTAEPSDGCFSAEGNQSSRSVTFSCPYLRSTFGHLKVAEPVHLVGLQSIDNEVGNSVRSVEIQPSILSSVSMDKTSMNICAGKVGCYTCHLAIDPFWPLCMFELRGKCNNDECPWQHVKDYSCKNMSLDNSDRTDCQVGSLTHKAKSYGATSTSKDNDGLDLATPTYLVCLDTLKADLHPRGSVIVRNVGLCWQKCFSSSLAISTLLPSDLPTEEPFLHGTQARTEVHGSWNGQSLYFHRKSGKMGQLDQQFADSDQSLEMALLNLHHEVNKRKGRIEALKVLARALEANLSSVILWVVYLHIYYSSEKSIGKDDMFHSAVEHNEGSYELWLMYINSRIQLKDRLVAYDNALLALCRHASAADCDTVHASACILDLFLQLVNCLCISGNADEAIEKINGIFPFTKNSDGPHPLLLSSILPCLTLYEKCIFWLSCVYILVYRKLPDTIVQQFECEKVISEMEWPSAHLTGDAKQQAVKLIEMAVDSLAVYIDSQSLESESTLKAAHVFAVNHIRCIAVLEGLECSRTLLEKYTKLYPSCLELVFMLGRMWEDDFVDSSFVGFKEALSNWPEDVPGVQCIWNQYAECVLQNGKYDFAKELMNQWFHSVWEVQHSQCEEDSLEEENSHSVGSLDLASGFNLDAWVSNSSETDAVFGLLNLSLYKLLQNDLSEARLAIDRALKAAAAEDYKHCVREHAMFLLSNDSHFKEGTSSGILSILKGYLVDPRAFPTCQPLSRKFIQSIKKPRVRQLVSNIWSIVSSDFSIINLVLGVCFGPSLLPQTFSKLKDLVDFVEAIMEILPSNYQLAMSICKLLGKCSNPADVTNASVSFWASSLLVNALFQAVPVAAEYVWVEAAGVLHNLTEIQSISESFHRRALSVYPFSLGLWKSYLNLSRIIGNTGSVIEAARERGIKLESTL